MTSEEYADVDATFIFSSANAPGGATLRFGSSAVFRSLTIQNQSSLLVSVWTNPQSGGPPNFSVLPGNYLSTPLASAVEVSLRFFAPLGGVASGIVYVHGCNTPLSASSGVAGAGGGAAGIVFDYSGFDTGAAFLT